jgi:alkanesulfonate monooxygenase SsuD/methylene tetrahydromethanopterin reductase-like flavin-dependent oxidoreductase (luciferase family)
MVSCNSHRNPALLAKMAATLDVISDGRLEFGIGAGVQEKEHVAYGFGFPKHSVRVERLAEALEVTRRLWTEKKANYQGKHFALKDAVCEPKPLQKPHPPITVGGSSELLMRKATAPNADRFDWGLLPFEEYKRKLDLLEKQCKTAGREFSEIEKSCWPAGQILIARNQKELSEKISKFKPANVTLETFKKTSLAGTPDECIEQLQVYADLGVTYFMLFFADLPKLEGLKQFSENVINKLS